MWGFIDVFRAETQETEAARNDQDILINTEQLASKFGCNWHTYS